LSNIALLSRCSANARAMTAAQKTGGAGLGAQTVNGYLTVNRIQGVVFGRKMIIILSQLQPLLILTMV